MNSHKPGSNFLRWTLAIVDGLLFGWFIFISRLATRMLIKVSEFVLSDWNPSRLPGLTNFARFVLPEETWSLTSGVICFGMGFGLISLNSRESPTSRLFRWMMILALTLIVAVSLPAIEAFKNLINDSNDSLDEWLFFCLGMSTLIYGAFQLHSHSRGRRA